MTLDNFQNPPKQYREVPFWSWNDDLDPQELVRQIELMDQAGWGGFFMHARVGLRTPYMGSRWMECIRASVKAAKEHGMQAWLYDEDKWPSGFAGGLSVAENPAYRSQCLVCKVDNRPALLAERIATFAAREVSHQLVDIHPDDHPLLKNTNDRMIQFYPLRMPVGQAWFNGFSYIDLLNPQAVSTFLATTHEAYAQEFGEEFGQTIPGIFTDEPAYISMGGWNTPGVRFIPWTDGFPEYFQKTNGYDLLPHLPNLFLMINEDSQTYRYDFWRTITRRFVESYTRQVADWCHSKGLAYTGHYMAEDTLHSQIQWIGAAMAHYPYMDIPGIDKLCRSINEGAGTVLTVKQLDSVVCQTGKSRALCENYGCSGQDFAHTGRKWLGDWAYVLGITLNNPHLSLYSLRGDNKRDYPQNVFYQQPWWPENPLIANYFSRLSYVLSQGQRVTDLLVIHPMGSAWSLYQPLATYGVDQLDEALNSLGLTLMRHQRDFHFGDESLMAPDGATPGKVEVHPDGPRLVVGKMAYRLVVVPPGVTLARSTVELLQAFATAGGTILALPPYPLRIDGRKADRPVLPPTTRQINLADLPRVLDELLPFDVRLAGQPAIWVHHRRLDAMDIYFVANTDLDHGTMATLEVRGNGRLEAWDAATGIVRLCPSHVDGEITQTVLDLPPAGSHLLVLHSDQAAEEVQPVLRQVGAGIRLDRDWQLTLDGPNVLILNTPRLSIGMEPWSAHMDILDARDRVVRNGQGTPFSLRFTANLDFNPPDPVYLALENPDQFEILVNSQVLTNRSSHWWLDTAFKKIPLGGSLHAGKNEIVLKGIYHSDTELEAAYLIGAFSVYGHRIGMENRVNGQIFDRYSSEFRLLSLPEWVQVQTRSDGLAVDLTDSGLPFFAGRATLKQSIVLPSFSGRAELELRHLRAALASVRVNGQPVGTCAWHPHRIDLGSSLIPGENSLEIELVGTLRNLLGPHHRAGGDSAGTGPGDFRDKTHWTEDTILVPFGFDSAILRWFAPA